MPETSEINKNLGELEEELSKIKSASDMIIDAKETTEKTISETKEIMADLIKKTKKATDSVVKESNKLNETTSSLIKSVSVLSKKLEKVDFPVRLDKLDATVSGINAGIQNIQGRIDTLERNIKDEIGQVQTNMYLLFAVVIAFGIAIVRQLY